MRNARVRSDHAPDGVIAAFGRFVSSAPLEQLIVSVEAQGFAASCRNALSMHPRMIPLKNGAPGAIRTRNLSLRSMGGSLRPCTTEHAGLGISKT
jgi:hypothetical protein